LARIAGVTLIAVFAVFALALLAVRFVVFPRVESHRDDLSALIAREIGQPVEIDAITTGWDGWNPKLGLSGVRILDRHRAAAAPLLDLPRVDMVIAWTSLPLLELRLKQLVIDRPRLAVRRDRAGVLHVAGIEFDPTESTGDPRLADWMLDQGEILVRDALVAWDDDLRNAPQLLLDRVQLRLEHGFGVHRLGLRGTPPPELAAPIDVRAEWRGDRLRDWREIKGNLYARLDYADVAAWREWLALPIRISRGKGALRLWFGFSGGAARDLVGDVELEDAAVRLEDSLPELVLARVAGRFGWREEEGRHEIYGRNVRLERGDGTALDPHEFTVAWREASATAPATLAIEFDRARLDALRDVGTSLPLPEPVRTDLARYAPRGVLSRGRLQWDGPRDAPTAYSGRVDFADIGIAAVGVVPGGSGLSGSIEFTEAGGSLRVSSRDAALDLPRVFLAPIALNRLEGSATWRRRGGVVDVRIESLEFANAHAAGKASGTYRTAPNGPGSIDLAARVVDADATAAHRYVPRWISADTREWLGKAIRKGRAPEATLKLVGNLADFPFADGKGGTFLVVTRASGATLDFAEHWPGLTNVDADVRFEGKGMVIEARTARYLGAEVGRTRATIPDLDAEFPSLVVDGVAAGPIADFLRYVEDSPVAGWIGDVTDKAEGAGRGRLALRLDLLLGKAGHDKVAGAFTFDDAELRLRGVPSLSAVSGTLSFTEADLAATGIAAQVAGGPTQITIGRVGGKLGLTAAGTAGVAELKREFGLPFGDHFSGTMPWTLALDLGSDSPVWTVESTLRGTAIDLPPPLGKAADGTAALRVVRAPLPDGRGEDTLTVSYGGVLDATLRRKLDADGPTVEQGLVELGAARTGTLPARLDRPGLWVRGSLPELDLDRWLGELRREPDRPAQRGAPALTLSGFDVDVGALEAFGGRWHDLKIGGRTAANDLRLVLAGREVEGTAVWSPAAADHPNGRLSARLARLAIGGDDGSAGSRDSTRGDPALASGWPELDITADSFVSKNRPLGRLEVVAKPSGGEWQIDRLRLANDDGSIAADGAWRGSGRAQQTKLDVVLDVGDPAGFLRRLGFPDAMQGAPTTIKGQLAWAGAPNSLDYPTLSGTFRVDVGAGRFTKVDPGIGKLLGVLSLQALPRRIALDFRDIFSEGFAFDQINGTVRVDRGVLTTDNLKLVGPAAKVEIAGAADLEHETQRLQVKVQPALSAGVSAGAALLFLANPVVGAAVGAGSLLAQKILQDPIEQMFSYTYNVAGSWSDPVVTRGGPGAAPGSTEGGSR
jgi:uncharacterized protein (TIGR02099 family)